MPLQGAHALALNRRHAVTSALVNPGELNPTSEGLRRAAKLGGKSRNAGPLGAVFVRLVEDQPNGPFMHFGRKAFPVLRPDILSRKEISWIPGAIQGVDNDFLE